MSIWSQCLLQESASVTIELLSLFHDYSLSLILMILFFVGGVSVSMLYNSYISDYVIVTSVEVIWTVIPMFILLFLAVPSLRVLYFIDDVDPYFTFKILGRQ